MRQTPVIDERVIDFIIFEDDLKWETGEGEEIVADADFCQPAWSMFSGDSLVATRFVKAKLITYKKGKK